jgi:mannose-6-phosphate isomerase-like protein (cupin superfamily)
MIFNKNIIELSLQNDHFRKEVITGTHSQIVLMSLLPNEEIGKEIHKVDQILVIVQGTGKAILNG